MAALSHLLKAKGMEPIGFWPAHKDWRKNPEFDAVLGRAALVVLNGEGSIHHDNPAGRRLLEIGAAVRDANKRVALINAGWDDNGAELTDMLASFDIIAARDQKAAEQMAKRGAEVRVVPDLSIYAVEALANNLQGASFCGGIGVTDNVDRIKALKLERLRRSLSGRTISIHGKAEKNYLRFLRGGMSLRQDLKDPRRAAELIRLRHRLWKNRSADKGGFMMTVASLDFLVSGRFHATTIALAVGTPFVSQASNTGKIAAFARDVGLDDWRTNCDLTPQNLLDVARMGWSNSEADNRLSYLDAARSKSEALFADLRGLLL
jgi:Polysaccharide pyruvyl transferase